LNPLCNVDLQNIGQVMSKESIMLR
jgi:hypothetical protein